MKYGLTIADADADIAGTPAIGAQYRLKYSPVLCRKVGRIRMSALAAGVITLGRAFSSTGDDMQLVLKNSNPGLTAALSAKLAVTFDDDTTGFGVGTFAVPDYAPDAGHHMPQSLAVDLLPCAKGTLTSNNTNVSNADTVTVGGKTYTYKTALTPTEGEVLIGGSADASLLNLIRAINHTGTPDTDYKCAAANANVSADAAVVAHAFKVHALVGGETGDAIASTKVAATLTWSAATLTGGSSLSFKSVSSLSSMTGGAPGVELDLLVLPDDADWVEVQAPVTKNIDFGAAGSVAIGNRFNPAEWIVKARGGTPGVNLSSKHASFAQDIARCTGQKFAYMLERWADDRILAERTVVQSVLSTSRPVGESNDEVTATASGMGEHVLSFW
jgi:hypothetical protein